MHSDAWLVLHFIKKRIDSAGESYPESRSTISQDVPPQRRIGARFRSAAILTDGRIPLGTPPFAVLRYFSDPFARHGYADPKKSRMSRRTSTRFPYRFFPWAATASMLRFICCGSPKK